MKTMRHHLVFLFFISSVFSSYAQREERKLIDNGNAEYKAGKYNEAEILYRKSLEKNRESEIANYNLGDALYKQGKFEDAANIFQGIAGKTTDKDLKSKAYHNLGNSY
jgi:Ca-activated chloride channel family protein